MSIFCHTEFLNFSAQGVTADQHGSHLCRHRRHPSHLDARGVAEPHLRQSGRNVNDGGHRGRGGGEIAGTRVPAQANLVQDRALRHHDVRRLLSHLQRRLLGRPPLQRQVSHRTGPML